MIQGRQEVATSVPEPGAAEDAASRLVRLAIRHAQMGDRDAIGFLYARYADDVHRYARSIVQDHHAAEDVSQQVFAKLIVAIGKYEQREVPFLAWMLRVTRNVALDHLRRRHPIPVEELHLDSDEVRPTDSSERASELSQALESMPRAQREVVVLRHVAGLTPAEIARHIGRSESSVHGLHHRGRRALADELSARGLAPMTATPPSARLGSRGQLAPTAAKPRVA